MRIAESKTNRNFNRGFWDFSSCAFSDFSFFFQNFISLNFNNTIFQNMWFHRNWTSLYTWMSYSGGCIRNILKTRKIHIIFPKGKIVSCWMLFWSSLLCTLFKHEILYFKSSQLYVKSINFIFFHVNHKIAVI